MRNPLDNTLEPMPAAKGEDVKAKGENVEVVQELLKHANSSTTLELYQEADFDAKQHLLQRFQNPSS